MPDKLAEQVEELRRLEALAFLGVWKCEIQEGQQRDYARICGGERGSYIATVSDIEDAQLIVAVRNALPSLLTALEQYKLDAERYQCVVTMTSCRIRDLKLMQRGLGDDAFHEGVDAALLQEASK